MTAKEMAIDLDMKIVVNDNKRLRYEDIYNSDLYIEFFKVDKFIICNPTYDYQLDIPILKFINKQVSELGLLDE